MDIERNRSWEEKMNGERDGKGGGGYEGKENMK